MGANTGGPLAPRRWVFPGRRTPRPGGRTPRFFASGPTGRFLYTATGDSDDSLRFAVAGETGSPVCIVFRDAA